MIKVAVAGIAGRMGSRIAQLVCETPEMTLLGGWERASHPFVGVPIRALVSSAPEGLCVSGSPEDVVKEASVVIDFTSPEASLSHVRLCADHKVPMVIGTTGFSPEGVDEIRSLTSFIPVVLSPNMSVGVNVLFKLVEYTTKLLGKDFDVEIVEAHHRFKKDAPSGTAMKLGHIVAATRETDLEKAATFERHGMIGERKPGEIGIQTVRAGDIVGEHTVIFASLGERIEIIHRAHSRDNFARGALRAARWIIGKSAGLYDMFDVLGLK